MTLHRDLLEELNRNVLLLEELGQLDQDAFVNDPKHYLLAERCFQLAIQCVIDMGFTLASLRGWQRPTDSREAILVMGRQGVLPKDFAEKISTMANFRNILVHAYLGINRDLVYRYLSLTSDFRDFSKHLDDYLDLEASSD